MAIDEESQHDTLSILASVTERHNEQLLSSSRALDSKGSILLALLCLLMLREIDNVVLIWKLENCLHVVSAATAALGTVFCFWAIRLQNLIVPPAPSRLQELYEQGITSDELHAQIFSNFREAVEENNKIVQKKSRLLAFSYWLALVALLVFLASEIL